MRKVTVLVAMIMTIFLCSSVFAADANSILGKWRTDKKDTQIEIYKCGAQFCGKVIYMKYPNYVAGEKEGTEGTPRVDLMNPDRAKRATPLMGLNLLSGFVYSGDNLWENGTIYSPKKGKTYKCKLTLENPDLLKVRGYVGTPLLGETQMWTRVK